jgi:thiamine pyrophosphate-dependent acetolactate synthase large subunit-like protein
LTKVSVVVGPGVLPGGVDAVRRFARRTGLGVLNTWGVKGIFRWDDPAHLGTIGLQERDVELAGILEADRVLGVGLDDRELGPGDLGPRVEVVDPAHLDDLEVGDAVTAPGTLYGALRSALLPLYDTPGTPAHAAAALAASIPEGGVVCAEPGPVGLWVARALPTVELGSVFVPNEAGTGAALDHARSAAAGGRHAVYATHLPHDVAEPFRVEVWDDVDLALTRVLVDVAGPVRAWQGSGHGRPPAPAADGSS